MTKIRVLSEELRSRIAAGEVVERPASVVKELVENAIDACADCISIEIKQAGRDLIRVNDNGEGMDEADLSLAIQSYATSKIISMDDLFNIYTLGFRGEALSSIASVSNFRIISKNSTDETASFIDIEGGKIKKEGKINRSCGTTIEVKNLFFNTLPRRKFLKHDNTEFAHIVDVVTKLAISHPEIEFTLIRDEKRVLDLKKSGFKERIEELFPQTKGQLIYAESKNSLFKLRVFLSKPQLNYPRRIKQYFFINNRSVVSPLVYHAIDGAYRGLIEGRNYPAVFLFMGISSACIDVNVHPTKKEIRFKNENEIHDLLRGILKDELQGEEIITVMNMSGSQGANQQGFYQGGVESIVENFKGGVQESFLNLSYEPMCLNYKNKYLVWMNEEGLNILDQHAGWEKVLYEKFINTKIGEKLETQRLLLPEVVNLDLKEAVFLKENFEIFDNLGFEIKEFGTNSFIVHTRPVLLKLEPKEIIKEVISEVIMGMSPEDKFHKIAASLACHAAIKSGDRLNKNEVEELLKKVKNLKTPYCPHGRPVVVLIKWNDINKQFKR
ncbi:MAG: DNA mismatch repair endonuclease MutL [Candidatus Saelkia tenebricola]|nr:DNA mismatch repair endonuclease MutL [Candidatus Saelkia tenebricola]